MRIMEIKARAYAPVNKHTKSKIPPARRALCVARAIGLSESVAEFGAGGDDRKLAIVFNFIAGWVARPAGFCGVSCVTHLFAAAPHTLSTDMSVGMPFRG